MSKNYMSGVAKVLGVELEEEFLVKGIGDISGWIQAYLTEDGLMLQNVYMYNGDAHKYLARLITGKLEFEKLPWNPKNGEIYWTTFFLSDGKPFVYRLVWSGDSVDFSKKALGMVYRTEEEAKEHLAEDYEQLTGKPLSSH